MSGIFAERYNGSGNRDGTGANVKFNYLYGIAIDQQTSSLFVFDLRNHNIRKITPQGKSFSFFPLFWIFWLGEVSTVSGTGKKGFADGPSKFAKFYKPLGIHFDEIEHSLYVYDLGNNRLRRVSLQGKVVHFPFIVHSLSFSTLLTIHSSLFHSLSLLFALLSLLSYPFLSIPLPTFLFF
jgi:hypothetical protein